MLRLNAFQPPMFQRATKPQSVQFGNTAEAAQIEPPSLREVCDKLERFLRAPQNNLSVRYVTAWERNVAGEDIDPPFISVTTNDQQTADAIVAALREAGAQELSTPSSESDIVPVPIARSDAFTNQKGRNYKEFLVSGYPVCIAF